ncbi:sensor histidine kinase [Streptosporangium sp. CA-135522]|uniref:sensor histidine kinase n=1 Tax=Streptosporangium sp. CA-135522 TaxID=3240072 RepID=UPI003D91B11C
MAADERWLWRRYVLDALRPEPRTARPSGRALAADTLLAIFLTIAALMAAGGLQGPVHRVDVQSRPLVELLRLRPSPVSPSHPASPSSPASPDAGIGIRPPVPARIFPPPVPAPISPPPVPAPISPPPGVGSEGYEPPVLLVALTALPLAARRRYPLTTFWAVVSAALATNGGETWITVLTCAIAGYSVITHSRNRVPAVAGLLLAAVLAGAVDRDIAPSLPSWMGPYVVLLSAGVCASIVRFWRRSQDRLAELQQDQQDAMRKAVEAERSRIASELHDVVTHNVSVMVIQAGAARKVMDAEPELSKQALLAIETSGRAAMAELRNVMGLLAGSEGGHVDGRGDGLEPQPGLDQLGGLVERVRAAGVPVDVRVSPPPSPLPDGVGLAVYRVVQEALTNTMRHAAGAAASVAIDHSGDWLEIEVADTGGTRGPRSRTGNGRGLIGLRERLAVYGGTLVAGPTTGGGYQIRARLPWRTA